MSTLPDPPLPGPMVPPFSSVSQMALAVPVGAVMAYAGPLKPPQKDITSLSVNPPDSTNPPVENPLELWGWMVCDGRPLNTEDYPELFAALGYVYGGSGTSFNIPDFQGYFLRGIGTSNGATEDRKAASTKGTADGVGSTQEFAMQTHEHIYLAAQTIEATQGKPPSAAATGATSTLTQQGPTSSLNPPGNVKVSQVETRPDNVFVYYIIRYAGTPAIALRLQP